MAYPDETVLVSKHLLPFCFLLVTDTIVFSFLASMAMLSVRSLKRCSLLPGRMNKQK